MAKLTKAQARRRIIEARDKITLVTYAYKDIDSRLFNQLNKIATELASIRKKLK